jgi:hypothetical protein
MVLAVILPRACLTYAEDATEDHFDDIVRERAEAEKKKHVSYSVIPKFFRRKVRQRPGG